MKIRRRDSNESWTGKPYTPENFYEILRPMFAQIKKSDLKRPGNSYKELHALLSKAFKTSFTL
jgi:hypothetical protein